MTFAIARARLRLLLFLLLGCVGAQAQRVPPASLTPLKSSSGQFLVSRAPGRSPPPANTPADSAVRPTVDLVPTTLLLTCERVKQSLLRELALPDQWTGRIVVLINPGLEPNQPPIIGAQILAGGWQYQFEAPPRTEPAKLVRGLVQALLLEIANRWAGPRSAEIPLWLSEGLTQHLLHSSLTDLVVQPPQQTVNLVELSFVNRRLLRPDPLSESRERLATHAALSVARMGEWSPDGVSGETWKTFQASAHLFVYQLLQIPGARPALVQTLRQLPGCYNWQTAFLRAFQPVFPRMLDLEKWWSVVLVHFTGLDPLNAWSIALAADKLEDVLHPPVLVSSANRADLPRRQKATLQQIIEKWDYLRQRLVLRGVVSQLLTLRPKLPPEAVGLADDYRQTLENYIARRDRAANTRTLPGLSTPLPLRLAKETVATLDLLDERRRVLRASPAESVQHSTRGTQATPVRPAGR